MGIFDFLKKDKATSNLTTDNGLSGPTYLVGLTEHIVDPKKEKHFEWRRKLISKSGNSKFKIKYYGQLHNKYDALIVATEFAPALVIAQDISSGQEILLFDGCKNGYNAMFCEEFTAAQINNRSANVV